jgi:hypothetical protein
LNDDDIAEERPNFPQSSKLFIPVHIPAAIKRDNSQRNEICVRFIITCVRFLKECLLACSSCKTAGSREQGTPTAVSIIQLLSWP